MDQIFDSYSQESEAVQKSAELSSLARVQGNKLLKEKNQHSGLEHRRILYLYSKSIAYAPNNSEELALGYGNRSFLLSHLKMHELSIIDIDRAINITKSNALKAKLLCRKISSMKSLTKPVPQSLLNKAKKTIELTESGIEIQSNLKNLFKKAVNQKVDRNYRPHKRVNLPTINSNIELPGSSNSIQMVYNEKFGRHYEAVKDINPGEILVMEKGYATIQNIEQIYVVCSFCMNIAWTGVPCNNCPCVIYCSDQCKNAAWKSYHELECPILMLVFKDVSVIPNIFLTLRILSKGLQESSDRTLDYLLEEFISAKSCTDKRFKGFKKGIFNSESIRSIFSLTTYSDLSACLSTVNFSLIEHFSTILSVRFNKLFYASRFYPLLQKCNINTFKDFLLQILSLVGKNSCQYFTRNCYCKGANTLFGSHEKDCPAFLGITIGASSSLTNHSCIANVGKLCKDGKLILFAIRPIAKDEQIFEGYGPNFLEPVEERQLSLLLGYQFSCDCIACEQKWHIPKKLTVQFHQARSKFGLDYFYEVNKVLFAAEDDGKFLPKSDMKAMFDKLKSKINLVYRNNSLFDAISIMSVFAFFFSRMFEVYYGMDTYIPGDMENNS